MNKIKNINKTGFTIVETMIVLGVSGVMFVSAASMVTGQQAKARFKSSMTDIVSRIQSTINEASSGYYPSSNKLECIVGADGPEINETAAKEQGSNNDCIYLGRAIMFGPNTSDPQEYFLQTLVGLRKNGGNEVTNFAQAKVIAAGPSSGFDISETKELQYGTTTAWMKTDESTPLEVAGVAFVIDPSQTAYDGSGQLASGSLINSIVPILGSEDGLSNEDGEAAIKSVFGSAVSKKPVKLCFVSGGTEQSALVTVGAGGSNNMVDLRIFGGSSCT